MSWARDLFGPELANQSGKISVEQALAKKRVIGVYFSAHWCPPCRQFTPMLSEFYQQFIEEGKEFEIIFVSNDNDEDSFVSYFINMPWIALPFDNVAIKKALWTKFDVRGIPTLIILNEHGEIIDNDGRKTVGMSNGNTDAIWSKWSGSK